MIGFAELDELITADPILQDAAASRALRARFGCDPDAIATVAREAARQFQAAPELTELGALFLGGFDLALRVAEKRSP